MKRLFGAGCALAALLVHVPAEATRPPSVYLKCDGLPDNVTAGETAARLLGAVTLLGVFAPAHETANASSRLTGADGIAACNEALARESNDTRRAQLILGAAIHNLEAGHYDVAAAEARRADSDRPAFAATTGYRLSLHLAALDIEAAALFQAGHADEAMAKALEMASAAPYDVNNQIAAASYFSLLPHLGQAETAFYDRAVRLHPSLLAQRGVQRDLNGDTAGALADYELLIRLTDAQLGGAEPTLLTTVAISQALAGNVARARELYARATNPPAPPAPSPAPAASANASAPAAGSTPAAATGAPAVPAGKEAGPDPAANPSPNLIELRDFYHVWDVAHGGDLHAARALYLARSQWIFPSAMARAAMVRVLREGATPAELTGSLAQTPEAILDELRTRRRENTVKSVTDPARLFHRTANVLRQEDFNGLSRDVWAMEHSHIVDFPQGRDGAYRIYRINGGTASGYGLLLHAALLARHQDRNQIILFPVRLRIDQLSARAGNRGEEGMVPELSLDAAQVIADLSPLIPQQVPAAH
jgi:hypothetical protein